MATPSGARQPGAFCDFDAFAPLGGMMEENLRRAMKISFGDPMVLITRPISAAFLFAAVALLVAIALPALRAKREEAMQE